MAAGEASAATSRTGPGLGEIDKLPKFFLAIVLAQMIVPLVLALILLATKSRVAHYIGLGLLFVVILIHYGGLSIN